MRIKSVQKTPQVKDHWWDDVPEGCVIFSENTYYVRTQISGQWYNLRTGLILSASWVKGIVFKGEITLEV